MEVKVSGVTIWLHLEKVADAELFVLEILTAMKRQDRVSIMDRVLDEFCLGCGQPLYACSCRGT